MAKEKKEKPVHSHPFSTPNRQTISIAMPRFLLGTALQGAATVDRSKIRPVTGVQESYEGDPESARSTMALTFTCPCWRECQKVDSRRTPASP